MATKSNVKESSFRLGCGRYLQDSGAISLLGEEIRRLGGSRPFIIGGKTALSLTEPQIRASLDAAGITDVAIHTYEGFCCKSTCESIMQDERFISADTVVGVGGGNVMDAAKYCAVLSGKPIINLPTSSATCAAYTPLSVCYSEIGETVGTTHHKIEVNCVIVDTEILCRQPTRLLLSGVYDSLAKIYELKQRLIGVSVRDSDIGLYSSYHLSQFMTDLLYENLEECCADIRAGRNTKVVSDTVYALIALTGVISGLARGSNQTAIAHKVYESLRALYPEIVRGSLHGEMVAIGLIAQIAYNGDDDAEAFKARMERYGMPTSLSAIGLPKKDETLNLLYETMCRSSAMAGTTDEEKARLYTVLRMIQ